MSAVAAPDSGGTMCAPRGNALINWVCILTGICRGSP